MGVNNWVRKYYIDNLIAIIIENIIIVGLFFLVLGGKTNEQAPFIQIFLLMFIPKATVQIPLTGLVKSRIAFLRGKWRLKADEALDRNRNGKLTTPWRYLGPITLIISLLAAIPISFMAFIINNQGVWSSIITGLIAFFSTLAFSTIIMKLYPRDLALFADRILNSKQGAPESLPKYLMLEYFAPWSILVFLVNLVINYKSYAEKSMNPFGTASIELMILDTFIVAGVIIYWMWDVSQNQVRPDVHLRRLKELEPQSSRKIFSKLLILYFSLGLVIFGATIGMLYVLKLYRLTPFQGAIILSLEATIAGIIGCSLGVWFGMNREYQFIKEKGS